MLRLTPASGSSTRPPAPLPGRTPSTPTSASASPLSRSRRRRPGSPGPTTTRPGTTPTTGDPTERTPGSAPPYRGSAPPRRIRPLPPPRSRPEPRRVRRVAHLLAAPRQHHAELVVRAVHLPKDPGGVTTLAGERRLHELAESLQGIAVAGDRGGRGSLLPGGADVEDEVGVPGFAAHSAPQKSSAAKTAEATNTATARQARAWSPSCSAERSKNPPTTAPETANTNASGYRTSRKSSRQPPPIRRTSTTAPSANPRASPPKTGRTGARRRGLRWRVTLPREVTLHPHVVASPPPWPSCIAL